MFVPGIDESVVNRLAARALVLADGESVAVESDQGPAYAHSAAEVCLGGPVRFAGLNTVGHAVYRKTTS